MRTGTIIDHDKNQAAPWLKIQEGDCQRCALNTATETCPECGKEVCGGCMEDGRCLTCLFS